MKLRSLCIYSEPDRGNVLDIFYFSFRWNRSSSKHTRSYISHNATWCDLVKKFYQSVSLHVFSLQFAVSVFWAPCFDCHDDITMTSAGRAEPRPDSAPVKPQQVSRHVPRLKRKLTFTCDEEWWELRRRQLRFAFFFCLPAGSVLTLLSFGSRPGPSLSPFLDLFWLFMTKSRS